MKICELFKVKHIIPILCFATILSGCSEKKEEDSKIKQLNVLTEYSFEENVKSAETNMEMEDDSVKVSVQYLPQNEKERKTEIQKLRTQIMAGESPDVFLLDGISETLTEVKTPLLENPYQTMGSGALAPLDDFMDKDSYWRNSTYKEEFLKAGQYNGKQYIIPLSCTYFIYQRSQDMEEMTGNTLNDWLENAVLSSDNRVKDTFRKCLPNLSARWIQPAVNYDAGEVIFESDKRNSFANSYLAFRKTVTASDEPELSFRIREISKTGYENGMELQTVPDINGAKAAAITAYGAVGMASDYKQESYDFIMLFLNDRVENAISENPNITRPAMNGFIDPFHFPVQESALNTWMGTSDEGILREVKESFEEIDSAFFITNAERRMNKEVREINYLKTSKEQEQKLIKLSEDIENTYKVMIKE